MLISQSTRFSELQSRLHGQVLTDIDEAWDSARQTFNVLHDQRPAAIVRVASADDVAETVRYAAQRGLRIAPQSTGHNAGPIDGLEDALLVRTDALQDVRIDVAARRARVGSGVRWAAVSTRLRGGSRRASRLVARRRASPATRSAAAWAGSPASTAFRRTP